MTSKSFKTLPDHEQEMIIFSQGKLLSHTIKEYVYALYSLNLFFFECQCDTENFCIESKKIFKSGKELDKCLNWH